MRLPNSPLPPLGSVTEPWWDNCPLAIVGCGPSLKGFDFTRLNDPRWRVLAVNESIWDLPFAEAVFSLDRPHINRQADKLRAIATPKVFAVQPECAPCAEIEGSLYLLRSRFAGLSDDLTVIQSGGSSGFGAFNYAYLKRAKRIALFGLDYTNEFGDHYCDERYHWHKPGEMRSYWKNWGDSFIDCKAQLASAGVSVMNASPISTVVAFDKCSIDEGLEWLSA
jgi:hypothetical protein